MAYNTYNNNKDQNKEPTTTTYSISMANSESSIDQTRLALSFWENALCVSIQPRDTNNAGSNGEPVFDNKNSITIYLNGLRCKMLANEIRKFISDPVAFNGVGITSNDAIISISNGVEYGKNTPVITVRKVNENGVVTTSFAYEFKTNYYYAVRDYTGGSSFTKEFNEYEKAEINHFIDTLESYYVASNNAIAHTVMKQARYHFNKINTNINALLQNAGVSVPNSNNGQRRYSNTSYFNNSNGSSSGNDYSSGVSYEHASMDDLEADY